MTVSMVGRFGLSLDPIKREKVEKLRGLVEQHGVSIAAASREVGISRVTAYKYLAG